MSQRSTRKTKGALWAHALHLSPPGTPTLGLFTRPAEGALRRCPTLLLPGHTVEEQRARRFFLEGVSGFPLGYHIGSARTEVVRFFRCGGLAPLLAPARPRHVRVRMVSRFSAQAAKGRVQKYPSWEPVPVPVRRRWFFLKKTTLAKHTNKYFPS